MGYSIRTSQVLAISGTSAKFTNAMSPGCKYRFTATTDCWVKVTATGGAAAADTANNHLYIKGQTLILANPELSSTTDYFVHVIQDSAAGDATLSLIEGI